MGWTLDDMPDQSGRVAVVTGGNGGLGLACVTALADAGAHVVMAARNQQKAADAARRVRAGDPPGSVEVVGLDLGDLSSVRAAADAVLARHDAVDILLNNAGLMAMPQRRTVDGFEMQLGVNHLGHWALTAHLLPALLRADTARVVTVTSTAHLTGRGVDPANPHLARRYGPWRAYSQAKLANLHFAIGLHRQFARAGAHAASLAAHPGLSHSELQVTTVAEGGGGASAPVWAWLARTTGMSTADGARSQLRAATDPSAHGGEFFGPAWVTVGPPTRRLLLRRRLGLDRAIADLWQVSEQETGVRLDVAGVLASLPARSGGGSA